jgi:hypothetical protein
MASLLDLAQARLGGLLAPQRPSMAGLLGGRQPTGTLAGALQGYTPPQMTAMTNPQVMDYARNVAQTAQQNLQTQMSDLDKALVMDQGGINVGDRQALARLMEQVPGLMGATAYHGTPHNIQGKFDINKVGTGEGAQAYGHGMYFAENPAVATQYKNILSKPEFTKTAEGVELRGQLPRMLDETYSELVAKNGIQQTNYGDVTDLVGQRLDRQMKDALKANDMDWYNKTADMKLDLARFKENPPPNVGNLYKVDIPDADIPNMLNWDEPLSKQPKSVQDALAKFDPDLYSKKGSDYSPEERGESIYMRIANSQQAKNFPEASAVLESLGIKGIRYLDEGSRGNYQARTTYKGEPYGDIISFKTKSQLDDYIKQKKEEGFGIETFPQTSNFVVFDPTDVKILEKNSKKVEGLLD